MEEKTLLVKDVLARARAKYREKPSIKKVNFLIYGRHGCGKTRILSTCPGPVLVHSFDPGGSKTLKEFEQQGSIILNDSFEWDEAKDSHVMQDWQDEFNYLKREGVFEEIGTYAIDSGTRFIQCLMNEILKQEKRAIVKAGIIDVRKAQIQDYNTIMLLVTDLLVKNLLSLPCHFVMTGHLDSYQDHGDGKTYTSLTTYGKNKVMLPLLFDEFYFMDKEETSKGTKAVLYTDKDGKIDARTRIGGGKFATHEEPDIKALLTKAGYDSSDKPMLQLLKEEASTTDNQ